MKKMLVLLLMCCTIFTAQAQSKKARAKAQIVALQEGVLLVQLRNHQAYRDRLLAAQQVEKAEKNLAFEKDINTILLTAFAEDFDFCPVYFFYSDKTDSIQNGNYNFLLDKQLNPAKIADLARFKNIFYVGVRYAKFDTDFNLSAEENIVLMDQNFNPLEHPFPITDDKGWSPIYRITWNSRAKRYGRFEDWMTDKPTKSIAQLWNDKLHTYYNFWTTH